MGDATETKEGIEVNGNLVTSITEIEVLDLLGNGEYEGIVDSEYIYTGTEGTVGWDSVVEKPFPDPITYSSSDDFNVAGYGWLRSIYWNAVPIVNSNNQYNFQRVNLKKTEGFPNGSILSAGSPELTVSRPVNERLRGSVVTKDGYITDINKDFTKVYRVLNKNCRAVIVNVKIPSISLTDINTGDIKKTSVSWFIYYKPFFSNASKQFDLGANYVVSNGYVLGANETVTGKLSSAYIRSTKIIFPDGPTLEKDFLGWEIKVIRTTPDSVSVYTQNNTYIDSITEVYQDKFSYPESVLVKSNFNAEFFQNVPQRSYDVRMTKVLVPSNYDPIRKHYTPVNPGYEWDGTFASEKKWTDNPAWCFYDWITNDFYGLSKYIRNINLDKFGLYQIGKYCDTLVQDGYGGLEPIMTCNIIFQNRDDAFKTINDFASIFNAIVVYAGNRIFISQDVAKSVKTYFVNADVLDGNFLYSSSAKKARHTVAIVRYNDKNNFYKPAIEYVQDVDGIRKYGIKEIDMEAVGCTSRGQANRLGKWAILSEILETETVSFKAGSDAADLLPGDIIGVYDYNRKTYRHCGRILNYSTSNSNGLVRVDNDITSDLDSNTVYNFVVVTPTYQLDGYQNVGSDVMDLDSSDIPNLRRSFVQKIPFTGNHITSSNGYSTIELSGLINTTDYTLPDYAIWAIESTGDIQTYDQYSKMANRSYDYYRVISNVEDGNQYTINALQYVEDKFSDILSGISFQRSLASIQLTPSAPKNIVSNVYTKGKNQKLVKYSFVPPDNVDGLSSYRVYAASSFAANYTPSNSELVGILPITTTSASYVPANTGNFEIRVYGYNDEAGILSSTYSNDTFSVGDINLIENITIGSLSYRSWTGLASTGSQTKDNIIINNDDSPIFTWQVGVDGGIEPSNYSYRFTVRPDSSTSIPSQTVYYQVTGITDTQYQFTFAQNVSASGGPFRNYNVVVEAIDSDGRTSAGNIISTSGNYELGWYDNPQGYDIIRVSNSIIPTVNVTGNARNYIYIDYNGGLNFLFGTGVVPSGVQGGVIWGATGSFTSGDVVSGNPMITRRDFTYNSAERYAYAPAVFNPFLNFKTGYAAIGFYDSFDYEIKNYTNLDSGININGPYAVWTTGFVQDFEIKGRATFTTAQNFTGDQQSLMITNNTSPGVYRLAVVDASGNQLIAISRK